MARVDISIHADLLVLSSSRRRRVSRRLTRRVLLVASELSLNFNTTENVIRGMLG